MWDALTGRLGQRAVCLGAIAVVLWYSEVDWVIISGVIALALVMEFLAYIEGISAGIQTVIQMSPDKVDEIRQLLKDHNDQ